ncbi:glycosyltransferase family 39 protein [Clostridium niameyense]|uniref:Glycosyltransferase family 39 protein n=1 Tax=Clostridium niameyense TaxID=1622073 RepID=A0A6M0R781_9CLOT|nr:glycosyltransferase family 39 protein [Clostridium niameyense]NEZ46106.1 glycosyltransferase family 39 protein [Clostridium niameyense]
MDMLSVTSYSKKEQKSNYYRNVILLSLILSVLWVIFINAKPFSDFDYYYKLATNISKGGKWGNTYTSVGYSIILGGIFKIFGPSVVVAKIFNLILTFVNNLIFLAILRKIEITEKHRKIIFTMFALFPNNIFYNSVLGTEILFTTVLLLITYIYFTDMKYKYIIIGILTGLNTMVKPFFIAYAFAIFLVELLKERSLLKPIKSFLIIFLVGNICIAPWIYRNTKLNGQFTYVSNNGGIVLYINNNSQNKTGMWMPASDVKDSLVEKDEYKRASMTEKNNMLKKEAKKWIKSHPKEFVNLGVKRLVITYMCGNDTLYSTYGSNLSENTKITLFYAINVIRNLVFIPAIIYMIFYSLFIIVKMIKRKTNKLNKFNLYCTVIFYMFTTVYFVTEGQGRYAFPLIFIMVYFWYYLINHFILIIKEFKR